MQAPEYEFCIETAVKNEHSNVWLCVVSMTDWKFLPMLCFCLTFPIWAIENCSYGRPATARFFFYYFLDGDAHLESIVFSSLAVRHMMCRFSQFIVALQSPCNCITNGFQQCSIYIEIYRCSSGGKLFGLQIVSAYPTATGYILQFSFLRVHT